MIRAALREVEGEAEEGEAEEHEALEADWKREYRVAFVELALSRGWDRENAEAWAIEIVDDAFIEANAKTPTEQAELDVRQCENA